MFRNCYSLTSIDLSNINTSKIVNMSQIFESCGKLTSLNLTHFDTKKVLYMNNYFIIVVL